MELKITQPDPLGILSSTKSVVENSQFVAINPTKLEDAAQKIATRFKQGLGTVEMGYLVTDNLANDAQTVFLEDAVNFCFWAGKGQPKWQVKFEDDITDGGWFGLITSFKRGLKEGSPILDAKYLSGMTLEDGQHFFRGANGVEIPLLEERVKIFNDIGQVLLEKFDGQFINVLEQAEFDAVKLSKAAIEHFPSFRDVSKQQGKELFFLKRAQILPNDLNYVCKPKGKPIRNLNDLTAFADYKLPQILRMFGVLEYTEQLARKIDDYVEIAHDTEEEIEIRSATVWAVELLRQMIPDLTAGDIDNTLWLMSQSVQKESQPYHRTKTIYY